MTKKSLNLILARLAAIEDEMSALRAAVLAAAPVRQTKTAAKKKAAKPATKKAPAKKRTYIPRPKANGSAHAV